MRGVEEEGPHQVAPRHDHPVALGAVEARPTRRALSLHRERQTEKADCLNMLLTNSIYYQL